MIIGGPFAFLIGLFSLGAAGVSGMLQQAQYDAAYQAEVARKKEMANHNYLPKVVQNDFEGIAYDRCRRNIIASTNRIRMEHDIWKEFMDVRLPYGVTSREIMACAVAKHVTEDWFGYEYCIDNAKWNIPHWIDLKKYYADDKYYTDESEKVIVLPWEEIINSRLYREVYSYHYIFHRAMQRHQRRGEFEPNIDISYRELEPPTDPTINTMHWYV